MEVASISPSLGPSTGGTDVYIQVCTFPNIQLSNKSCLGTVLQPEADPKHSLVQGFGLRTPLSCIFSSQTATKKVTAQVVGTTTAICTAPAWEVGLTAADFAMLTVTAAGCSSARGFQFYRPPFVTRVSPARLPRYGSFPVTAVLNASLADLAGSETVSLSDSPRSASL